MSLKIVWKKGVAHVTGSVAGERVRRSLGTRERGLAEELRANIEAEIWKRHTYGDPAVRTFEEAAVSYQRAKGGVRFLDRVILHFRGRIVGSIKPGEIRQAAQILYPSAKPATWNRQVLTPARAVINHAAELGWCSMIRVPAFPAAKPMRVAVDRTWIDAFLAQADQDGLPHVAAAMLFMHQTGSRIGEVVRVLPHDVDLVERTIMLRKTKTDTFVVKHITQELVIRLANMDMTDGEPVFGYSQRYGLYQRIKAVARRAGIAWASPHQAGRHSFATNSLEYGAGIKETMEAGGFKSVGLFMNTYVHGRESGKKVAAVFDNILPTDKPGLCQVVGEKRKK